MAAELAPHTLLAHWNLGPLLEARTPASGTVNRTILLDTATGRYALRAYRHRDRAPVAREHAVIAHVRPRGLPAVSPIPLPDGETILARDGRFYALFPRAEGHQVARGQLGTGESAAMGTFLASLQRALRDYPSEEAVRRTYTFDRATTLGRLARLEAVIRERDGADPTDTVALARLAGQRAWLNGQPATFAVGHEILGEQVIHGDYQESNLFFAAGRVCAVIDWDQTYLGSRAWEIVRTLHLAFGFAPALCRAFLSAYRTDSPLAVSDLDRAAEVYSVMRAHDFWVYEEYYLAGNERVRQFITPATFVPLTENWARLRPALASTR